MPENFKSSLMTHECIHAAWRVCDLVGIQNTSDNHEALAYIAGYIAKQASLAFYNRP